MPGTAVPHFQTVTKNSLGEKHRGEHIRALSKPIMVFAKRFVPPHPPSTEKKPKTQGPAHHPATLKTPGGDRVGAKKRISPQQTEMSGQTKSPSGVLKKSNRWWGNFPGKARLTGLGP